MNDLLSEILPSIRYVRLKFTIQFTEDTTMSYNKASAFRGGIGEMLLRANCIHNRQCDACGFVEECMVQRTMYSQFKKTPPFINKGESVGYILECSDHRREFQAGDTMYFYLSLFGKTIVYFSQYISALYALSQEGVGANHSHFQLVDIHNTFGESMLSGYNIDMSKYVVRTLEDYVQSRRKHLATEPFNHYQMNLMTPTSIKRNGQMLSDFDMEAFCLALKRRLVIFSYFEDMDESICEAFMNYKEMQFPEVIQKDCKYLNVHRHSNRKDQNIRLDGITGVVDLTNLNEDMFTLLLAGEILQVGKNTSFGFGKYRIKNI